MSDASLRKIALNLLIMSTIVGLQKVECCHTEEFLLNTISAAHLKSMSDTYRRCFYERAVFFNFN